jgi:hypothetical protein
MNSWEELKMGGFSFGLFRLDSKQKGGAFDFSD